MGCRSGKLEELYEYYTSCSGVYHAGRTTFYEVFKSHWSKALKFRHLGQHARCSTCAKLGEMRLLANTREAKEHVQTMYDEHVTSVFKDRATMANLERLSAESTRARPGAPEVEADQNSVLHLCVDGMDQAKFRLPRNLQLTKQSDQKRRPQEHCVGVLAAGVGEYYFLLPPDTAKD